jgi:hypothetical protein
MLTITSPKIPAPPDYVKLLYQRIDKAIAKALERNREVVDVVIPKKYLKLLPQVIDICLKDGYEVETFKTRPCWLYYKNCNTILRVTL